MLIEEHDGRVPPDMEALERLPGVGHKTARGCDGRVCEICRTCYPNRKHPKRTRKA